MPADPNFNRPSPLQGHDPGMKLLTLHKISHVPFAIGIAVSRVLLELPVITQSVLLDVFQRRLPGIDALLKGGAQLHADISHCGLREFYRYFIFAGRSPGCDTRIDFGVIVGHSGSRGSNAS